MRAVSPCLIIALISILFGGCAHSPDASGETRPCEVSDLDAFDSTPRMENATEIGDRMVRLYQERGFADGGFSGTARVCLVLDAAGAIDEHWLVEGSGITALDRLAMDVAAMMRFSPAVADGEPVAATIVVPLALQRR